MKNGAASTAERAAAAAGRTPAADNASGQSDSTARVGVGASGIRQAAAGGMAWRMGRPAQPSARATAKAGRTHGDGSLGDAEIGW